MKNFLRTSKAKVGVFAVLAIVLVGASFARMSQAASSGLYLSGSSSVTKGSKLNVAMYVNLSEKVSGVESTVTYDSSKLQYIGISNSSSFPGLIPDDISNGALKIDRFSYSSVSGNARVVTISFKVLAGGTSTKINLSGNATSADTLAYLNPSTSGLTVSLNNPVVATKPPSDGSSGGSSSGGSGSSSGSGGSNSGSDDSGSSSPDLGEGSSDEDSNKPDSVKPDIKIKKAEFKKIVINLSAKQKFRSYILFGTDPGTLVATTKKTGFATSHDLSLPESMLIPGTTFHYKVVTEDEKGNKGESELQSVKTKGYTISMLLLDMYYRPIKNSNVTLFSEPMEATTDKDGRVMFTDVSPGKHHVEYTQDGQKYSRELIVHEGEVRVAEDGSESADQQELTVVMTDVNFADTSSSPMVIPAAIAAAILLAIAGGFIVLKRKNKLPFGKFSSQHAGNYEQTSVTSSEETGNNQLDKVQGVNRPDPGSVVSPHHDDKESK